MDKIVLYHGTSDKIMGQSFFLCDTSAADPAA